MPEDLPVRDLVSRVARTTDPPPFETIVSRARGHRRRQLRVAAVTVAVATAGAIGIGAVVAHNHGGADAPPIGPTPTPPSSSATTKEDADAIIREGAPDFFAANGTGGLMIVWRSCEDPREGTGCRYAWQLRDPRGTFTGRALGRLPIPYAAGESQSFVVLSEDKPGIVVDRDGQTRTLTEAGSAQAIATGQLVRNDRARPLVIDPVTATYWPVPADPGVTDWGEGKVSRTDRLWILEQAAGQTRVAWTSGTGWQHHDMPASSSGQPLPGYLAVSGDRIAAMSGYDGASVLPVADLAVSSDGGQTWTDLHQADLPFKYVDAMAATSGGTLYVVTPGGEKLFRSTDSTWTRFEELPNPDRIDVLSPAGGSVLAIGGTFQNLKVFTYDDAGRASAVEVAR